MDLAEHPFSNLGINLESLGKGYEQWSVVQGTANIDGSVTNIHVPSLRSHCWKWPHMSTRLAVVGIVGDGTLSSIGYNFAKFRTQLGSVRYTDGRIETLVGTSEVYSVAVGDKFVRTFKICCYDHQAYVVRSHFQPWGPQHIVTAKCTFDSSQATCVKSPPVLGQVCAGGFTQPVAVTVFTDRKCGTGDTIGPPCTYQPCCGWGKGCLPCSSSGDYPYLTQEFLPERTCYATTGPELTATLLSCQIAQPCQLRPGTWRLTGALPACSDGVADNADVYCGGVVADRTYAVRPSSTTEDAPDTSAAGQNATVLGCVGLDAVVAAVQKQSYQPLDVTIAVAVQEIVEADSAGVMFTRHPVTADPAQLLITENYCLGETGWWSFHQKVTKLNLNCHNAKGVQHTSKRFFTVTGILKLKVILLGYN
ncbi:hypothetical protein J6590_038158 [Homalodisca vitripennis]|nr:hypothetical protein J6590_038158 [Homalodisca vitripennis]